MEGLPAEVARFVAARHSVASRGELIRFVPGWQIDKLIDRGVLERVERGVYRIVGSPDTFRQAVRVAVLRAGAGSLAGPSTSLRLHRVEGFGDREAPRSARLRPRLDVIVPAERGVTGSVGFSVRRIQIPPVDRTSCAGIPCLSPTRALLESARDPRVSERALRVAIDDLRRRRLTSLVLLRRRAQVQHRHVGARRCLEILAQPAAAAESEGERRLWPLVEGLRPAPLWGVADLVPGRRFDLAWSMLRLALEYDGRDHHVLPGDRDRDGQRDLECAQAGLMVLRITHGMLSWDWDATRDRVHRVFEQRKARMLA